jgi:predicted O-methyltransferase YrrM
MPGNPTRRDRIDPVVDYATHLSGPVPDYLDWVERQTYLKTIAPQQMSGRLQGRVLAMLAKLTAPDRILEVGTFTGYATLCLAEGLTPTGTIDTIEGDAETASRARMHFSRTPFTDRIRLHVGAAKELLPELPGPYDLIFLDADKRGYPDYLAPLTERLRPGGLLLTDNVLWDGKAGRSNTDPTVVALHRFNELVAGDPGLECVVLPLRDGLSVVRKRN